MAYYHINTAGIFFFPVYAYYSSCWCLTNVRNTKCSTRFDVMFNSSILSLPISDSLNPIHNVVHLLRQVVPYTTKQTLWVFLITCSSPAASHKDQYAPIIPFWNILFSNVKSNSTNLKKRVLNVRWCDPGLWPSIYILTTALLRKAQLSPNVNFHS